MGRPRLLLVMLVAFCQEMDSLRTPATHRYLAQPVPFTPIARRIRSRPRSCFPLRASAGGTEYVRLFERPDGFDLGTARVSLASSCDQTVTLVATIHLGDRAYFEQLQNDLGQNNRVLFELVVGNELTQTDTDAGMRQLSAPIGPSPAQLALSRKYGLRHQLEVMRLNDDNWFIADLERDEMAKLRAQGFDELTRQFVRGVENAAWILPATELSREAMEQWFFSGGTPQNNGAQRILLLIAAVALFLPCPEVLGLTIEWLLRSRGQRWGRSLQVLGAVARLTLLQDFLCARRLVLAHDLVVGQLQPPVGLYQVMISARNAKVVECLRQALHVGPASADEHTCSPAATPADRSPPPQQIGVMYGALHFDDMMMRLLRSGDFRLVAPGSSAVGGAKAAESTPGPAPGAEKGAETAGDMEWNVAWSMRNAAFGSPREVIGFVSALAALLLLGSLDWLDVVTASLNEADCLVYGSKEVIFSQWPGTSIVIPVETLTQCPDEDTVSIAIAAKVLPYTARHLWQFWVLRSLLVAGDGGT